MTPLSDEDLTLDTPRLTLRPLASTDASWCWEMFSSADVLRYINGGNPSSRERFDEDMRHRVRRSAGGRIGMWAITDKRNGEACGTTFLLPLPIDERETPWELVNGDSLPDRDIELGYILRQKAWGRGIATEAAGRLIRFAFETGDIDPIWAIIDEPNHASRGVLTKIGFEDVGYRYAYAEQSLSFKLTRQRWEAHRST